MIDNEIRTINQVMFNLLLSEAIFVGYLIWFVTIKNWDGCYIIGSFAVIESVALLVLAIVKRKKQKSSN